jgi:hypothetical protein
MKETYSKLISATVAILLVVCINSPSLVKLSHYINGHHLAGCQERNALHIHKAEFNCAFHNFYLSPQLSLEHQDIEIKPYGVIQKIYHSIYLFQDKYRQLHFSLRAPPEIS